MIRLTVDGAILEEAEVLKLLAIPLRCVLGTVFSLTPAAPMLLLFGLKAKHIHMTALRVARLLALAW